MEGIVTRPDENSGYHWIKRQDGFTLKKKTSMESERIKASCKENLGPFFQKLIDLEKQNNYRPELMVFFVIIIILFRISLILMKHHVVLKNTRNLVL
ncbi:MAG: hypothetical protein LBG48_03610 [Rickettsiales bacterium]|jgi:hypothetical protein|nr:hypothetical protein [Rickettsiales bacterium]